ncbi:helix-turn-helix transcriptional regulator [Streptosporangiaceae bacterium NEAU-GS5]|nr:helix-turn-helix transcriptional regulator [Streptosporangiaceae bacterium NEAU-GS5]
MLLLLGQCGGELPSGYLAARFQHSWPTTSRHLKVLEDAGLVEVRRERRSSNYRLNRERLEHVVAGWLRYLEPVDPEQRWSPSGPRSTSELAQRAPSGSIESTSGNSSAQLEGRDEHDDTQDFPDGL